MNQTNITEALAAYSVTDAEIAAATEVAMALKVNGIKDREGLRLVHSARMEIARKRVEVEKTRKELKADALKFGRAVDAEAKRLTALLLPAEEHLKAQEDAITEEKERIKRETEAKMRIILDGRIAKLAAVGSSIPSAELESLTVDQFRSALAEATALYQEGQRKAEEERLAREAAEREAQAKREAAEREAQAKREADEKVIAEERARLYVERQRLDTERERLAAAEGERQRQADVERAKAAAVEQARLHAEQFAAEKAERERRADEERKRLEALRPCREKAEAYLAAIEAVPIPACPWASGLHGIRGVFLARASRLMLEGQA